MSTTTRLSVIALKVDFPFTAAVTSTFTTHCNQSWLACGRLAVFYFGGQPQAACIFRYYKFDEHVDTTDSVQMRLVMLYPELEQTLGKTPNRSD
jgi:hypothetical protein